MQLPIFASLLAFAAISTVTTALPFESSSGYDDKMGGKNDGGNNGGNGVCSQVGIIAARATQVRAAFDNANLVPEAIATINPKVELSVSYGAKSANLGNTFAITETVLRPDIRFTAERDYDPVATKYLILFVDPDAPMPNDAGTPALLSFFLHQATWNASPSCIDPANNGGGEDITIPAYRALTPLSVAQHRYVQLVYRQPPNFQRPSELALTTSNFDLNKFVRDNGLVNVGAQFFRAGALNVLPTDLPVRE